MTAATEHQPPKVAADAAAFFVQPLLDHAECDTGPKSDAIPK